GAPGTEGADLVEADVSEAGKGWSDNWIIEALETSPSMVYRVRKQLVEEGFEAVLSRKPRAMPAVARIFDGEKEPKLRPARLDYESERNGTANLFMMCISRNSI